MILPPFLKPGDTIGITAPARKVSVDDIADGIRLLEAWGFKTKPAPHLFATHNQFAGSDEQRAEGFQTLLDDPSVKAIICARGGYGSVRIIDLLDFSTFVKQPKWICGFSDITVFHMHLQANYDVASLHGPTLYNLSGSRLNAEAGEAFRRALTGTPMSYQEEAPAEFASLQRNGTATGKLVGGNLSLLYALSGSVSFPDFTGKILFLEDLDEYLYHIDRMLQQLKRSGKLKDLAGLVVGGMSGMNDNLVHYGKTAEEIIAETVEEYNYPVCYGFPAGHIDRNLSLVMGAEVMMEVSGNRVKLRSSFV